MRRGRSAVAAATSEHNASYLAKFATDGKIPPQGSAAEDLSAAWCVLKAKTGDAAYEVGKLYFSAGDYAKAAAAMQKAVTLPGLSDADDAHAVLGMALARQGKKAEAANINLAPLGNELKFVNLPVNYRSDGEVLAYVDKIFKEKLKNAPGLIGEDITELTTYHQQVQPGRVPGGSGVGVTHGRFTARVSVGTRTCPIRPALS